MPTRWSRGCGKALGVLTSRRRVFPKFGTAAQTERRRDASVLSISLMCVHFPLAQTAPLQHISTCRSGIPPGCAVSSVVEHFLDTEGVRGSNPLSRTILSVL